MDITRLVEATQILPSGDWTRHQARVARTLALIERLTATTDRLVQLLARREDRRR